ncbi:MAG: hypothetical protein KJ850_11225 [Gammaproteobacteria bacterium]|nr:hypothetical protein [Gammaproteobacteria bacterium]MBU1625601.1 hypothetical protein [Gammaproteobacteria bacterium]MBU1980861.1 hypothetical protein [Gammaproteobacteria bacterium]
MKLILFGLIAIILFVIYRRWVWNRRLGFMKDYQLPDAVLERFRQKRSGLSAEQERRVRDALYQYFHICQRARGKFVSMPSQVVDDLWHDFILFTRNYERFCDKAFGRFLHHTPVEAMSTPTLATDGIRRTWFHACRMEGIDPKQPARLPLLFALDAELGIAEGFHYTLNCEQTATSSNNTFCASSIGCGGSSSGCGGDSGHGDGGGGGCGGGGD